jgi:hypothetical protein
MLKTIFRTVAVALLLTGIAAQAQFRTSIQGVVTDSTGAVVPGATLTLKNNATNETVTHTSGADGVYNFNALPTDTFTLTVSGKGFKQKVLSNVQLIPEQANGLNVKLELGELSQSVTVDASTSPLMDTQTANVQATINSNQIQHFSSAGRDIFQLTDLAPGVVADDAQGSGGGTYNAPGNQTGGGPSGATDGIFKTENGPSANANGGQFETNSITIDGISTVSAVWGGSSVITPTEDSVGDIKIVTNDYDAEDGRFSGAQIQVTSKTGTNQLHGSAFFRINRPGLDAYQTYNGPGSLNPGTAAQRGLNRDNARFNQFGGSLGGPIWKDKVFGFFAWETIRNNSSNTGNGWYDTPAFDALGTTGSIAATYLTFPGAGVANATLVTQTCATAGMFEGVNCRTIAGQGLNIGSPLPYSRGTQDMTYINGNSHATGVGSGLANVADIAFYNTVNPTKTIQSQYNGRVDADATKHDHLAAAIYWVPQGTSFYNGPNRAYDIFHHHQVNDAFSLIWNHTFSPNFVNEARANAAGWRWNEVTDNPQSPVGLPADSVGSGVSLNQFGPNIGSHLNQWTYTYKDVATKVLRQHTIKFGGEITRLYYVQDPTYNDRPSYNFFDVWDFLNDAPNAEGGSFNALTGVPSGSPRQDNREDLFGLFVQDAYKLKPNLTLNYGLRYSYFGALDSKQNTLSVVQLGQGAALLTGITMRQGGNLWTPQKGNFGPELSLNWSPDYFHSKLVVRAGYGLNYNQEEIAISSNGANNPPGANSPYFNSSSPTAINPNIIYGISSSPTNLFGYAANPHTVTTFNAAGLPTAGSANLTAFPSNIHTAYSHHYSIEGDYDLGHQLVASVAYEGSSSHHLIRHVGLNAVAAAQKLTLNPLVTGIDEYGNDGGANNNALLLEVKHQMAHHFMVDTQFTWAKSMDDNSGPYSEDAYPFNPRYAYGRSDFNVGKAFKVYGLWQPVFFHGSNAWAEKIAGGWSVSGIFNMHTGFGWTPTYYTPNLYCANCGYGSLRPQYLGGAKHARANVVYEKLPGTPGSNFPLLTSTSGGSTGNGNNYHNPYFNVPDYTAALAGSTFPGVAAGLPPVPGISRNSFDAPGYKDLDAALTKAFGLPKMRVIGDDAKLEIRADFFNLFNNLNINAGSIQNNISAPNFGQAGSALGSRTINFQARFSF